MVVFKIYLREHDISVFETADAIGYVVQDIDPRWSEYKKFILDHPDAVQPEPLPPEPTAAQLEARAEAQRQALFLDYDHAASKCRRHIEEGDTSRDWPAMLAAWNAYGMALEALNDTDGWFRAPVWLTKPEI